MGKEKVVFFLDYATIDRTAREKHYRLDYYDVLQYIGEDRFLVDAYCYVPINPRNEHRLDGEIEEFWRSGYIVTTRQGTIVGRSYTCNFAVEITMDVLKVVYQMKPDIIVLATSNPDFLSLIQEVRKSGMRVEVAAFEEATLTDMQLKCSGFINLSVYYESYLSAQNEAQDEDGAQEQYQPLMQEQEMVEQTDMQSQERDLRRDDVEFPAEQAVNEAGSAVSDRELY